ncbi:Hypothetical_protein [Hexamita inflata]|uniref:Hypothetical_protein n=1 Tax=Hexamita inflata TaxID=28002 RepID=A0AA86TXV6_9EUKA|nr:Hypothetical protein HINF_LOCUS18767 [Hexamita inflata]
MHYNLLLCEKSDQTLSYVVVRQSTMKIHFGSVFWYNEDSQKELPKKRIDYQIIERKLPEEGHSSSVGLECGCSLLNKVNLQMNTQLEILWQFIEENSILMQEASIITNSTRSQIQSSLVSEIQLIQLKLYYYKYQFTISH